MYSHRWVSEPLFSVILRSKCDTVRALVSAGFNEWLSKFDFEVG